MEVASPGTALGAVALAGCIYYLCKIYRAGCRIQLVAADTKTSAVVRQTKKEGVVTVHDILYRHCPSLTNPSLAFMVPTFYLCTGLLQTLYATLRVRQRDNASNIEYDRELLLMPDGGTVSLDWHPRRYSTNSNAPLVIMLAGVGGSSQEYHLRATAKQLAISQRFQADMRVVVLNHRGAARTPITSPRPYDSGFTQDLRSTVRHIRQHNPHSPLVGVGFSMGANILAKYLGEEGSKCEFTCAVTLCCPFDIKISSLAINERNLLNDYVLQPTVMSSIMRAIKRAEHIPVDPSWNIDVEKVNMAKRTKELEEEILVKVNGCKSLEEYYALASSLKYLKSIQIPFLAINSMDDRITPASGIPLKAFLDHPSLALALVPHGGHMGFLTGVRPKIWFIQPMLEFISAVLS